ncbi:MAG: GntR family transcriptional regulator [Rhodobacteraceae bacterium]|jgi:DNA-binding GntR family transcriptional regulator|nr:GntR family transcriptional regulator [Paracoccaceae bacterium]
MLPSASSEDGIGGFGAPMPSRTETVAARLRDAITGGRLPAGERLSLDGLARQFGVSRMPVRDALKILESEGLVRIYPYRGIEVSRLDADDIAELFGLREVLEQRAAVRGVPLLTETDLAAMEALLREMDALVEDSDQDRWLDLNNRFHAIINTASGWPRLVEMITVLRTNVDRYVRAYLLELGRAGPQRQHWELLDACRRRDPEGAATVMTGHLRDTADALIARLAARPAGAAAPAPASGTDPARPQLRRKD